MRVTGVPEYEGTKGKVRNRADVKLGCLSGYVSGVKSQLLRERGWLCRATCFSFLSFIREERENKCIWSLERTVAYVTNLSSSHVGIQYVEIITIRFFSLNT
jgi:hypothetical protein